MLFIVLLGSCWLFWSSTSSSLMAACETDDPAADFYHYHHYLAMMRNPYVINPYYHYPPYYYYRHRYRPRISSMIDPFLDEEHQDDIGGQQRQQQEETILGRTPSLFRQSSSNSISNEVGHQEGRLFTGGALLNALLSSAGVASNPLARPLPLISPSRFSSLATSLTGIGGLTPCTAPSGEQGVCTTSGVCSAYGGRSSGSCGVFGSSVCCINTVTQCGSVVTLNSTYWTSPTSPGVADSTTCSLTVRLDASLLEQRKGPVCQVRLDFESFAIGQPNNQTVCGSDSFRVGGTSNKVPVICGDNAAQHMYLHAPSSTGDFQLIFQFGTGVTVQRTWRIRITMLACGSTNLAPPDCLQYYTQSSGIVQSFNWKEVPPAAAAPRQLANQDYNVCFRTEQISTTSLLSKVATTLCLTACTITATGFPLPQPFSLTGDSTSSYLPSGTGAGAFAPSCPNTDFLIFDMGVDSSNPSIFNDRFCGNAFNAQSLTITQATLCSSIKPFNLYYRTDGSEASTEVANNGFCLRFEQRAT